MATCSMGNCIIMCPAGCGCIGTKGGNWCDCFCSYSGFKTPTGIDQADSEMIVDFCAKDLPLTYLASYFDFLFPDQILIPASKSHIQVTEELKQVKLGALIEKIGLVPAKKPLVGRSFSKIKIDCDCE
ncbi:hypothetical protein COF68_17920 [Bacillus toyonensis]|uniref:hypothetical protein n=1 Tax=Bacillus toyonensis TaxID=155322 RepID=UPI000BECE9FC|nr:hypothetical protein [Bacillus toyonensis]PEB22162.1 hypothetical protein COO05_23620 [Bacillus toyonensis]PHE61175.1 hypothetical protein COF68_17920 [Bacillus toyonensis]